MVASQHNAHDTVIHSWLSYTVTQLSRHLDWTKSGCTFSRRWRWSRTCTICEIYVYFTPCVIFAVYMFSTLMSWIAYIQSFYRVKNAKKIPRNPRKNQIPFFKTKTDQRAWLPGIWQWNICIWLCGRVSYRKLDTMYFQSLLKHTNIGSHEEV